MHEQNVIVGRYAYIIYNEGGLLDVNVAGYPSEAVSGTVAGTEPAITNQTKYKNALGYADLSIPGIGLNAGQIDKLVEWRNRASLTGDKVTGYYRYVTRNPTGFLSPSNTDDPSGKTDRMFLGRQQLIEFFTNQLNGGAALDGTLKNALQYLGTFSRALNQPSYWPDPAQPKVSGSGQFVNGAYGGGNSALGKDFVTADLAKGWNPPFAMIRALSPFERNDQSLAEVGEPLMKKRFALEKLCWITCEGPSASASAVVRAEYVKRGVSEELLDQGTEANIRKFFGLRWRGVSGQKGGSWDYTSPQAGSGTDPAEQVHSLSEVQALNREPDFFEILKAAIKSGSLGKTFTGGWGATWGPGPDTNPNRNNWNPQGDTNVDLHIVQIGANIIDQANPTRFPTWIKFAIQPNSATPAQPRNVFGNQDLPYFNSIPHFAFTVRNATTGFDPSEGQPFIKPGVEVNASNQGLGVALAAPCVWNPYDESSSPGDLLGPEQLRATILTAPVFETEATYVKTAQPKSSLSNANFNQPSVSLLEWQEESRNAIVFPYAPGLYRNPTILSQTRPMPVVGIPEGNTSFSSRGYPDGFPDVGDPNVKYAGFLIATYPVQFNSPAGPLTPDTTTGAVNKIQMSGISQATDADTLRLYYQVGNRWIPYQEISYADQSGLPLSPYVKEDGSAAYPFLAAPTSWANGRWFADSAWEPRTTRFGTWRDMKTQPFSGGVMTQRTLWHSLSAAPINSGRGVETSWGWTASGGVRMARLARNITGEDTYYADADGVVRRGTAAYGTDALPMQAPVQASTRPVFLHRPFRSVAELGYVFRDIPWKNLDFFTPESGDSALLDAFCIHDTDGLAPLTAGKVDLNTRQPKVLEALISGVSQDELKTDAAALLSDGSSPKARDIARALFQRTVVGTDPQPLANIADLVGRWKAGGYQGFSADLNALPQTAPAPQRFREAAMRALSDTGMAGTWNLMIDLVAQTGRYAANSTTPADFLVEGERRYWVHVAIDRLTGRILDQQIELVKE